MNERTLRSELERAIERYLAGTPLETCLAESPAEVHPYLRVFDQIAVAHSAAVRQEFGSTLRRRFVSGAVGEIAGSSRQPSRLSRVASAAAAAFIVGAVVNPALADELVHQVGRTFGHTMSEFVSAVLNDNEVPGVSGDEPGNVEPAVTGDSAAAVAPEVVVPGDTPAADAPVADEASPAATGTGGHASVPEDEFGAHPVSPAAPSGDSTEPAPDEDEDSPPAEGDEDAAPRAAAPAARPAAPPAASGGTATSPPAAAAAPAAPADTGGGTTPAAPAADSPAEAPPAAAEPAQPAPPETEEDEGGTPPGLALTDKPGRGGDLPDNANGGNRDAALDHAADSGNKTGLAGAGGASAEAPGKTTAAPGRVVAASAADDPGKPAVVAAGVPEKPSTPAKPERDDKEEHDAGTPGPAAHSSAAKAEKPESAAADHSDEGGAPEHAGKPEDKGGKPEGGPPGKT